MTESLTRTRFDNPRLSRLGVELITLEQLHRKAGERLARPERVEFLMLMLPSAGWGRHTVDFEQLRLEPGQLLVVRPGQVQQWHPDQCQEASLQARILLIDPTVLPGADLLNLSREVALLEIDRWPTQIELEVAEIEAFRRGLALLQQDFDRFDQSGTQIALIRAQLLALLLRLGGRATTAAERPRGGAGTALLSGVYCRVGAALCAPPSVKFLYRHDRLRTEQFAPGLSSRPGPDRQSGDRSTHPAAGAAAVGTLAGVGSRSRSSAGIQRDHQLHQVLPPPLRSNAVTVPSQAAGALIRAVIGVVTGIVQIPQLGSPCLARYFWWYSSAR